MKPAVTVAFFGVIFPMFVFFAVAHGFGYEIPESVFLGIVFAATSVSITVEVLQEFDRLKTKDGTTILGAAVVDDVLAVILLSLFLTVFGKETHTESGPNLPIWMSLLIQVAYVVFIFIVMKYLAPFVMGLADKMTMFASSTIFAVVICLAMAELAQLCGLSDVIGAFFAGIAVSQTNVEEKIEHNISLLSYSFFIPVFFASIGLGMSFSGILDNWPILIVFTLLAILTKLIPCAIGAKLNGFTWASGYTIGAGMVSRGEMALIVAQIGFASKLIDAGLYSELVVIIILSTIIAPFLLKHSFTFNKREI
jgi:Kef-type K+ transport system membrane component KefB